MSKTASVPPEAPTDCGLCPRLVAYRQASQEKNPDWFNGAVQSFGDPDARLLVIGLAPGITGANRTGRPFTGDWAGDLLYETLGKFGFAKGIYDKRPDDGLTLIDAMVTNAVRCVPPQNKPVGAEINQCRPFLKARMGALSNLKVMLCLGKISHDSTVRALGLRLKDYPFGHNTAYETSSGLLLSSYHCSRYNTNTRRLTPEMFEQVFARARAAIDA
ncbi:MAG: uracil-DNA glycosylase [Henriciella sp.]|nr:uracil-DNA glycosylase [Henriciella sp.]